MQRTYLVMLQSQPCHWRNAKTLTKRSILSPTLAPTSQALSENVSLFQSLRVLQDGEATESEASPSNSEYSLCSQERDIVRIAIVSVTCHLSVQGSQSGESREGCCI